MFFCPSNHFKETLPKRSLFSQVKFLDKVWIPAGAILIDTTYTGNDELFICHSIHDMLNHLRSYYFRNGRNTQTSFFKISIYNLNADEVIPDIKITYRQSKDILCKHAYCRYLFISPNLKEVYCEAFRLFDNEEKTRGSNITYDYGVLYGDYPQYENLDIVTSKYLHKAQVDEDMKNCKEFVIDNTDTERLKNLDTEYNSGDVSIFYRVFTDMEPYAPDYPHSEVYDGCLPVATFTKVGHAEPPETDIE